ncbi:alpha/beta hydrolase family protein [Phycisphaerales bacterium AB-hyl4]|uniref:Alpha/beta hydrolase family protein n=1 Tax=Natronomicrosphaera hydrolytica TaxID=3242702 RepID=A0ABV4U995_9BACT
MRTVSRCCLVVLLVHLLFSPGCAMQLAEVMVKAPNQGLSVADVERKPSRARFGRETESRFRVDVGTPGVSDASLAVRVLDPSPVPMLGVKLEPVASRDRYQFALVYAKEDQVVEPVPTEPRGTIIVLHGIFGSKDTLPAMWGRVAAGAGYRSVLVDLRGQGHSTGDWLTYGVLESRDLVQVLDELERRELLAGPVGVIGISYGGATAIQLAAIDPRVEAVVAFAPFATFESVVPDFGRAILGPFAWLVSPTTTHNAIRYTQHHNGTPPIAASPLEAIARTNAAVLLLHGQRDRHVPLRHSRQLLHAARGPAKLVVLEHEDHESLAMRPRHSLMQLREEILNWLSLWLDPNDPDQKVAEADVARNITQ